MAYSPTPHADARLPANRPPLVREHRLYQADWLLRFYGFEPGEVAAPGANLDLDIDPKLAWALQHRDVFPLDVNRADRTLLLRVPGLGVRSVAGILAARRHHRLRLEDVVRLGASARSVRPFIVAEGWSPGASLDSGSLRAKLTPEPQQLGLF